MFMLAGLAWDKKSKKMRSILFKVGKLQIAGLTSVIYSGLSSAFALDPAAVCYRIIVN